MKGEGQALALRFAVGALPKRAYSGNWQEDSYLSFFFKRPYVVVNCDARGSTGKEDGCHQSASSLYGLAESRPSCCELFVSPTRCFIQVSFAGVKILTSVNELAPIGGNSRMV